MPEVHTNWRIHDYSKTKLRTWRFDLPSHDEVTRVAAYVRQQNDMPRKNSGHVSARARSSHVNPR